jgi:hypothetical protein
MDAREVSERAACLPLERLEAEIQTQAAHLAAAECRWLLYVAEYDRREGWKSWECWSCVMWLGWKCGLTRRSAQEKVRVARALEELPIITEAFSKGELSYSQVRAITRVAEPATEETLVMWARHSTTAQLEQIVRGYGRCARSDEEIARTNDRHERRYLSWHWDDDGSLVGSFRLDPEEGAMVAKALEAVEKVRSGERTASAEPETREAHSPIGARRADALVAIADSALAHEPRVRAGDDRYQVVVHVDAETVANDANGRCELDGGPALAPETLRRLMCDTSVVGMLDDPDGNPLAVGTKTRTIPHALRRALKARDTQCRYPGCGRPVDHWHHIVFHSNHGPTNLENLVGLCRFHHRSVHEGGVTIDALDDGTLEFVLPDGRTAEDHKPATEVAGPGIEHANRDHGLLIDAATIDSRWDGTPLDTPAATEILMVQRRRARHRVGAT